MANVLIIDDDPSLNSMLAEMVTRMGHQPATAFNLKKGIRIASSQPFDVVFLDVWLPDGNGLDALPVISSTPSHPEVIIITAEGDPGGAETAINSGAWDYIEKPDSISNIKLPLIRALQYREARKASRPPVALNLDGIVGGSASFKSCIDQVAEAAASEANVLITGETGTGKDLFAWAVHNNGARAHRNFVAVDCASLPVTLVESVLFGHVKGAFTGADRLQEGLIRQADGGTLFLDEVGELPLTMQKAFLRVLEGHRFRAIGDKVETVSNFRLIAATNKNLEEMVKRQQFREDLLFRLQAVTIALPPLRGRPEDIREIASHYIDKLCRKYGMETKGLAPEFLDALVRYRWAGNVRELVHTLERSLATARHEPMLYPKHLPNPIRVYVAKNAVLESRKRKDLLIGPDSSSAELDQWKTVRESSVSLAERKYLDDLLSITRGDIKEACRVSGLSRPRLYTLMKKHKLLKGASRWMTA
jgi:two-component system, NtrC family, response regulator